MYSFLKTEILPQLIPPNSTVLAAVSGGPDSVALAHVIWRYAKDNQEQNIALVITHVNHRARPESNSEAQIVKALADEWGVRFILHEFHAKNYAKSIQKSFQEASRQYRYERWQEDMQNYNCDLLATAHHLGDQAETVLYRLLRGSGTAGLSGIYPHKGNIIRPLLSITKKQILEYCKNEQLTYAIDQSNYLPTYERNKIRLELIPLLENQYNDRVQEALGRTAEVLRWDEEYIASQVKTIWSDYCISMNESQIILSHKIWEFPEAILSRFLRKAAAFISGEQRGIEHKFVKNMMNGGRKIGWSQDLPGLKVESLRNGFAFFRKELVQKHVSVEGINTRYPRVLKDTLLLPEKWNELDENWRVGIFKELPDVIEEGNIVYWTALTVLDKESNVICRTRRAGDKVFFRKLGHKPIKKVFQDHRISAQERDKIPLIALENSIIWIPGICRSNSFVPKDLDNSMYCIFIK